MIYLLILLLRLSMAEETIITVKDELVFRTHNVKGEEIELIVKSYKNASQSFQVTLHKNINDAQYYQSEPITAEKI